jgi:hypothetical protein
MAVVERTAAGLQTVIPGCERRTLPRSTTRVDEGGQGLLHFYKPRAFAKNSQGKRMHLYSRNEAEGATKKWFVRLIVAERRGRGNSRMVTPRNSTWNNGPIRRGGGAAY